MSEKLSEATNVGLCVLRYLWPLAESVINRGASEKMYFSASFVNIIYIENVKRLAENKRDVFTEICGFGVSCCEVYTS